MPPSERTGTQIHRYTDTQVHRYTYIYIYIYIQIHRYTDTPNASLLLLLILRKKILATKYHKRQRYLATYYPRINFRDGCNP